MIQLDEAPFTYLMKVAQVHLHVFPMPISWLTETRLATPVAPYEHLAERRSSWYGQMTGGVVEIVTDEGVSGLGFVGSGQAQASAVLLDNQLRSLLVGENALAHRRIRDILDRARWHHGRSGIGSSLLSAIDLALWDIKGKVAGRPVYELLGGPTRSELTAYLTTADASAVVDLEIAHAKIALPHGPESGPTGIKANVEAVARARELLGAEATLAVDCYMGWDVPYTRKMAEELASYGVAWIEEPVHPTDFESYQRLAETIEVPLSGGEHLYDPADFRRLIDAGVDLVQPDLQRVGGITVALDIAALARASRRQLMCHGFGSPSYHFLISLEATVAPMAEYLDIESTSTAPWVFEGEPRPRKGAITLDDTPGFGYRIRSDLEPGDPIALIW